MKSKDYNASLWDTAEELNRNDCFNDLAYRNMTFDRDDRPEHLLSKAARAYAENFQPALEQHGIMFTGNVGTGKTFYACCIANAVIDRGCTAWVTTFQPLVRALCSYESAEKILAKIRKVDLLLDLLFSEKIPDLGSFLCVFGERRQYSVEYEFVIENEVIRYSFEVDTEKELISEKLYLGDKMLLDRMGFSAKSYIADSNGADYRSEVSKDTLFLRTLYFNTKFAFNPVLSAWIDLLKGSAYINMHERQIIHYGKTDVSITRYLDNGFRETVNRFFDDHGFEQSIVINRDTQDGTPFSIGDTDIENMILVKHKGINLPIPFAQESVGNQNLLRILPVFLTVIHNGGMLLIDDFSGAFHNDLESLLVRYFMEKSNHSQLLFVSHSTNLLSNSILRPDQEYSVEFRNEEGSSVNPIRIPR